MSDNYPVDPGDLRQKGSRGVMATGAGLGLWGVSALLHVPVVGMVLSGGLVLLGIMGFAGKSSTDKVSGGILMAAGAAGLATIVLPGLTSLLLGAGGLALVGYGVFNILKFVRGLKNRA